MAGFALALMLGGCGSHPTGTAPVALDKPLQAALALRFPNSHISIDHYTEARATPGDFDFAATVETQSRRAITSLRGEFDPRTHGVRILYSETEERN